MTDQFKVGQWNEVKIGGGQSKRSSNSEDKSQVGRAQQSATNKFKAAAPHSFQQYLAFTAQSIAMMGILKARLINASWPL